MIVWDVLPTHRGAERYFRWKHPDWFEFHLFAGAESGAHSANEAAYNSLLDRWEIPSVVKSHKLEIGTNGKDTNGE